MNDVADRQARIIVRGVRRCPLPKMAADLVASYLRAAVEEQESGGLWIAPMEIAGAKMKQLIALVGVRYRGPEMEELLKALPQGEPLELRREPTNEIDPKAVQVWARGRHLGYLKSSHNKNIAAWMDRLREAKGESVSPPAKLALDGSRWPMVEAEF